jgi:hypothetical protein
MSGQQTHCAATERGNNDQGDLKWNAADVFGYGYSGQIAAPLNGNLLVIII